MRMFGLFYILFYSIGRAKLELNRNYMSHGFKIRSMARDCDIYEDLKGNTWYIDPETGKDIKCHIRYKDGCKIIVSTDKNKKVLKNITMENINNDTNEFSKKYNLLRNQAINNNKKCFFISYHDERCGTYDVSTNKKYEMKKYKYASGKVGYFIRYFNTKLQKSKYNKPTWISIPTEWQDSTNEKWNEYINRYIERRKQQ